MVTIIAEKTPEMGEGTFRLYETENPHQTIAYVYIRNQREDQIVHEQLLEKFGTFHLVKCWVYEDVIVHKIDIRRK